MHLYIPQLYLLELHLKTTSVINHLPHFHGPHWSALFRNLLKRYLPQGLDMASANIWLQTVETGIISYNKGDPINLGLIFPKEHESAVNALLSDFNNCNVDNGHFQPGLTVAIESAMCRISSEAYLSGCGLPLSLAMFEDEVQALLSLHSFDIEFTSPLRMPRPAGTKKEGHHFCDEEFFLSGSGQDRFRHFLTKIRLPVSVLPDAEVEAAISDGCLYWLDIGYGQQDHKTIGGITGGVKIEGALNRFTAELLVAGQYVGAGKNPVFGFGFYKIPQIQSVSRVKPLTRGMSLLQRAFQPANLESSLNKLPNSSPGPDMISVDDAKKAGEAYLRNLSNSVLDNTYRHGSLKKYRLPKSDGSYREIFVQNVSDRIIHRAASDYLAPVVDRLLSNSAYAYRKGLNRKGAATALKRALQDGYISGLKADISAFFDSVNLELLGVMLRGLFPQEPLVKSVLKWFYESQHYGSKGLPQGNPLSPLMSNIYLVRFDRNMEQEGFLLMRYADDFVLMFKHDSSHDEVKEKVTASLKRLGLALKEKKTEEIRSNSNIEFLGYAVTESEIQEADKTQDVSGAEWTQVFTDNWRTGSPVYITSICRGAYSSGQSLCVTNANNDIESIPWSSISRIVVVGRSGFTAGILYRAVREKIPITFIDVMGRIQGCLSAEEVEQPDMISLQQKHIQDSEYRLTFAKEIIAAKIENSAVILRRNNLEYEKLKDLARSAKQAHDLDSLRGYEGAAAKMYFEGLAQIVSPFEFKGRAYHPPDGPVNVMLSFGYTLLYNRIAAVLKDKGFNARKGFFHQSRGNHAALASDLLEELRHIAERVMLTMIHNKEISENDFSLQQRGKANVCRLKGEGFRNFIRRYEITMASRFAYQDGRQISYNVYLDEMADKLRRSLKLSIPYKGLRIR